MAKKNNIGLGLAALAVGAGAVAAVTKGHKAEVKKEERKAAVKAAKQDYRNTELGRYDKNSKGIYYSNGNYEAFARPKKPAGVDEKNAYIVGSGLASLAAACFLVRDGQMPGSHIHILEAMDIAGGACDGIFDPTRGYVMRGGREMENHFECLWDLFRSIPSLEVPGASVLDEYYWLNKEDPNYSLCRATKDCGQDAHTDGKFNLSQKGCMEIMKLFMTKDEDLYDKTIEDVFDDEVFNSTFWLYWRTMFAFENWHSALEMKLYFQRFIHHISGLPDFSALKFTKYNQYESLILPMKKYLEAAGVDFQFNTEVTNVIFDINDGKKVAKAIECKVKGVEKGIVDLSLAPTPAVGDSVARILEIIGVGTCGGPGTTCALAMLNDAVKKGGVMASSSVGGLSGAFIPVSEDAGMIAAVEAGALSLEKLEAMTCVCSVGLDMIAIPGDTPVETIAGIIADEMAIGVINNKTTAVRVIPAIGKGVGDCVEYGGLFGRAPIMPVNPNAGTVLAHRGGRFPAPLNSLKN